MVHTIQANRHNNLLTCVLRFQDPKRSKHSATFSGLRFTAVFIVILFCSISCTHAEKQLFGNVHLDYRGLNFATNVFDSPANDTRILKVEVGSKVNNSLGYWPIVLFVTPLVSWILAALNVPLPLLTLAKFAFQVLVMAFNSVVLRRYVEFALEGLLAILRGQYGMAFSFNIV